MMTPEEIAEIRANVAFLRTSTLAEAEENVQLMSASSKRPARIMLGFGFPGQRTLPTPEQAELILRLPQHLGLALTTVEDLLERIEALQDQVRGEEGRADLHANLNEACARALGIDHVRPDGVLPSWHDMPQRIAALRSEPSPATKGHVGACLPPRKEGRRSRASASSNATATALRVASFVCVVDVPAADCMLLPDSDTRRMTRWVTIVYTEVCDPVWHVLADPDSLQGATLHCIQFGNDRREPTPEERAIFTERLPLAPGSEASE